MVSINLKSNSEELLTVIVRDHELNEVWQGVLNQEREITLPAGEYLVESSGVDGRRLSPLSCNETATSVALNVDQHILKTMQARGLETSVHPAAKSNNTGISAGFGRALQIPATVTAPQSHDISQTTQQPRRRALQRLLSEVQFSEATRSSESLYSEYSSLALRFAIWSKAPGKGWTLNTDPSLEHLRTGIGRLRFLRISGRDRRPLLVSLPERVSSISIPIQSAMEGGVAINEPHSDAVILRAMMERRSFRQAALLAVSKAKKQKEGLPGAAQTALALVSLFAELDEEEQPSLSWFKEVANRFPHLADPLIAYAWYGAYRSELSENEFCNALLAGVERGVPQLVGSLDLLRRGLELLARERANPKVSGALESVRNWNDHLVPNTFLTTFFGTGRQILSGTKSKAASISGYDLPGTTIHKLGYEIEAGFVVIGDEVSLN